MAQEELYSDATTLDHKREYYYNAESPHELVAVKYDYSPEYYIDFVVKDTPGSYDRLISNSTHYSYVFNN